MVRAVVYTGLLTIFGTATVTFFLMQQVASGLYQERLDQVQAEATAVLVEARSGFEQISPGERPENEAQVEQVLENVGGAGAQLHREQLLVPLSEEDSSINPRASGGITEDVLGEELRTTVLEGDLQSQYWQPVAIPSEGETSPGVAFGINVTMPAGDPYGLFFVYDFAPVQQNVNFVFASFLTAGGAMLLINVLIAAWVSRSVVRPVSHAAEVSERIAAGQLDQRLAVVGEDEIARLGVSFNRMASTLQEQITQLANLSRMQQRFVSDVSHELRTPLTTISMASTMLHDSREDFDPVTQRSTELLHHQVERFQALLADLLEMSRFDAGAAELTLSEVDVGSLAREVLTSAVPLAEQAGAEVFMVVQGEGFVVEADRRRIDRILRNLINNAIEHSEARPVDVVLASSPTAVAVAVRDHGVGMDAGEVAHVFDRFWRSDPARARTTGGSGLGLSIATEDTRLHQGSLDAWGEKGNGSCFRLVLPRTQQAPYRASPLPLPPVYQAESRQALDIDALAFGPETDPCQVHDRVHEQSLYPEGDR